MTEQIMVMVPSPSSSPKTVLDQDLLPYSPHAVPDRELRFHSFRDDVRRTIYLHNFRPSKSRYTSVDDFYHLFLEDNGYSAPTPEIEERFRSALGRVLRPPSTADAFAKSFAAPSVQRRNGYISFVSPNCPTVDIRLHMQKLKRDEGRRRRQAAQESESISRLRETRRIQKLNRPSDIGPENAQHVSFRYVDEFLTLNCAEDLLNLKVSVHYWIQSI